MVRIGIINVTGYMGAEAARILHGHPTSRSSRSPAAAPLASHWAKSSPILRRSASWSKTS